MAAATIPSKCTRIRRRLIDAGKCLRCRQTFEASNQARYCPPCASVERERNSKRPRNTATERARRRLSDLCVNCARPIGSKSDAICDHCSVKRKQYKESAHLKLTEGNICRYCTRQQCEPKRKMCASCGAKSRERGMRKLRERLAAGVCTGCGIASPLPAMLDRDTLYRHCETCYLKCTAKDRLGARKHWQILKAQFEKQTYKCAYSGRVIELGVNDSLDHIIPVSRYPERAEDPTNIQWVTRDINLMKSNHLHSDFLAMIRDIYRCSVIVATPSPAPA